MGPVGRQILVVHDSSAMRAFVRAALEDGHDFDVHEADGGFSALRILPRQRYDAVIVEINMPDINGLELVAFMRKSDTHSATPLLIISTEASPRDRDRGLQLGANLYLAKPFSPDQLLAAVDQLLAA